MSTTYHKLLLFAFLYAPPAGAQRLAAAFRTDKTESCSPAVVSFEDLSLGNPVAWRWDFGNGNSSTLRNPVTTYVQAGTYTTTLIVTNQAGLSDTLVKKHLIQVVRNPVVAFLVDRQKACSPAPVRFTDNSKADGQTSLQKWEWDFGDGDKGVGPTPVHTYRREGEYAVTLRVTDNRGCYAVQLQPRMVKVAGTVKAGFTQTNPPQCGAPATVSYVNTSTGPPALSYTWLFGDGASSTETNPTHSYTRNDSFTVRLVARSAEGCVDTFVQTNPVVITNNKSDFYLNGKTCVGTPASLINNSIPAPASATWLFPDGSTSNVLHPQKVFASAGTFKVQLVNRYENCTDTITRDIVISGLPVMDFRSRDTTRCQPNLTSRFVTPTKAAAFVWQFGDGASATGANPVHTYTSFGNFTVTLTVTSADGCMATLTKPAYVRIQQPVLRLAEGPRSGCLPFRYRPQLALNPPEAIARYEWDFGDGGKATGARPAYTYRRQGEYDVSVTVTTRSGCTLRQVFPGAVKVGTRPRAAFTASPLSVCASTPVQFTNRSTGAEQYQWDFGDGGMSTAKDPAHQYADTGLMNVRLIVVNSGCPDTAVRRNYIRIRPPIANFAYRPDCLKPLEYRFADQSVDAKSWLWNFGDGTTHTGRQPPVHQFPKEGRYEVKLTTTNGSCTYTSVRVINVGPLQLDFTGTPRIACRPALINLQPAASDLGAVRSLVWLFDNGTVHIEKVSGPGGLGITLNEAGDYTVKLVSVDSFGCRRDSVTKLQYLRINGPQADFSSDNAITCTGRMVDFTDRSRNDGQNNLVQWEWNAGTGAPAQTGVTGPFQHRYDSIGAFTVSLKITDAAGCSHTESKPLFVRVTGIRANWNAAQQTCPGAPVSFSNTSSPQPFTALWRFGDGDSSNAVAPVHAFADTGYFTISLKVTSATGCTDSVTRPAYIYSGRPKASFDALNLVTYCIPYEGRFFNTSTYYATQYWDLGQSSATLKDPIAYFTQRGTYPIMLVVTSPGGCTDTARQVLTVKDLAEGKLEYAKRKACKPITVDFKAFEALNGRFIWDLGNGDVLDTNSHTITYTYKDFGSYVPRLILYEPTGCVLTLTGTDTLFSLGVDAKFSVNKNLFCDSGLLRVTDSTLFNDTALTYTWDFGDGSAATGVAAPVHQYNRSGSYDLLLRTVTSSGCTDSAAARIVISVTPQIDILGDSSLCLLERGRYYRRHQNPNGDPVSWNWILPDGRPSTTDPGTLLFRDSGTYRMRLTATNQDGCADTAHKNIRVHGLPVVIPPPPTSIIAGQSTLLTARYSSGVVQYNWMPPQSLNCANCPQPLAQPRANTQYLVSVVDSNGCRASATTSITVTCPGSNLFAPNTFSPNGDGRNDVFYLRGTGLERGRLLRIFNRWGAIVFEQREFAVNDAARGWNGSYRGGRPQPDVYVFQAEVYCTTGEILKLSGNVALIQ